MNRSMSCWTRCLKPAAGPGATTSTSRPRRTIRTDGAIIIVADPTCRGYPPGDPRNKKADAKNDPPKKDPKKK